MQNGILFLFIIFIFCKHGLFAINFFKVLHSNIIYLFLLFPFPVFLFSCHTIDFIFLYLVFLIEVELTYKVVPISAEQQSDSVLHINTFFSLYSFP